MNPFSSIPLPARLAFSGGRTSGYLLHNIIEAYGDLPQNLHVTFYNTGLELEETLTFVKRCEEEYKTPIRWLEYRRNRSEPIVVYRGKKPEVGQHGFVEVSYETASRNGEPFEEVIDCFSEFRRVLGNPPILPNPVQRICTAQMKQRTGDRFMAALGYSSFCTVIGLRRDEPSRVFQLLGCATSRLDYRVPLYEANVKEVNILDFWRKNKFDLELPHTEEMGTYQGNCDFCFLKRTDKIKRMATEYPERLKWWAKMEERTGTLFRNDRFSYVDLRDGKVPLDVLPCDANGEQQTCHCTD